jgi:hypothetical protein
MDLRAVKFAQAFRRTEGSDIKHGPNVGYHTYTEVVTEYGVYRSAMSQPREPFLEARKRRFFSSFRRISDKKAAPKLVETAEVKGADSTNGLRLPLPLGSCDEAGRNEFPFPVFPEVRRTLSRTNLYPSSTESESNSASEGRQIQEVSISYSSRKRQRSRIFV